MEEISVENVLDGFKKTLGDKIYTNRINDLPIITYMMIESEMDNELAIYKASVDIALKLVEQDISNLENALNSKSEEIYESKVSERINDFIQNSDIDLGTVNPEFDNQQEEIKQEEWLVHQKRVKVGSNALNKYRKEASDYFNSKVTELENSIKSIRDAHDKEAAERKKKEEENAVQTHKRVKAKNRRKGFSRIVSEFRGKYEPRLITRIVDWASVKHPDTGRNARVEILCGYYKFFAPAIGWFLCTIFGIWLAFWFWSTYFGPVIPHTNMAVTHVDQWNGATRRVFNAAPRDRLRPMTLPSDAAIVEWARKQKVVKPTTADIERGYIELEMIGVVNDVTPRMHNVSLTMLESELIQAWVDDRKRCWSAMNLGVPIDAIVVESEPGAAFLAFSPRVREVWESDSLVGKNTKDVYDPNGFEFKAPRSVSISYLAGVGYGGASDNGKKVRDDESARRIVLRDKQSWCMWLGTRFSREK